MRRPRPVLEALFALCTFVCGFEIFPSFHQAAHAMLAPHVHAGDAGFDELAAASAEVARDEAPAVERGSERHRHGADSLAHRGLAFLHAPDATPLVPLAGVLARLPSRERLRSAEHAPMRIAVARGPPAHGTVHASRSAA